MSLFFFAAVYTTNGELCVFPFTYKEGQYFGCTTVDRNDPWCSLETAYVSLWGVCDFSQGGIVPIGTKFHKTVRVILNHVSGFIWLVVMCGIRFHIFTIYKTNPGLHYFTIISWCKSRTIKENNLPFVDLSGMLCWKMFSKIVHYTCGFVYYIFCPALYQITYLSFTVAWLPCDISRMKRKHMRNLFYRWESNTV